jgi:tRNA nucleotidyltransferase/poly(A) polymerase
MKILSNTQASKKLMSILPQDIHILADLFKSAGFDLTLVGGCVRDVFLNQTPKDFDVCTNALPHEIIKILSNANILYTEQGKAFGVIVSRMCEDIEIASYRIDLNNTDDRNTDVKLGVTLEEDLFRRDLTINALAMSLNNYEIIDLVGGIDDLKNNIIRTVGQPEQRFMEDHLRKLRCIRFASRLCFTIETETLLAIQMDPSLNVAEERIVNELENAFGKTKSISDLVLWLSCSGLLDVIMKGIPTLPLEDIDCTKITDFTTFIASFIDKSKVSDTKGLEDALKDKKFTAKLCAGVRVLFDFDNVHTLCPIAFTNKLKSTDLNVLSLNAFHSDVLFGVAAKFKQKDGLSEELMAQGIKGKELGDKLKLIARQSLDEQIQIYENL